LNFLDGGKQNDEAKCLGVFSATIIFQNWICDRLSKSFSKIPLFYSDSCLERFKWLSVIRLSIFSICDMLIHSLALYMSGK